MEGEAWETLGNNPGKSGVFILIIPGQVYRGAVQAAHVDRQDYALVCQEGSCEIILTCRLVTTVGQDLEAETQGRLAKGPQTGINDLAVYFKEMGKLVEQKKISSRVRFLMQVCSLVIRYGCLKQSLQRCDQVEIVKDKPYLAKREEEWLQADLTSPLGSSSRPSQDLHLQSKSREAMGKHISK